MAEQPGTISSTSTPDRKVNPVSAAVFQPFRFLDLPVEIRVEIYRWHLVSHRKVVRLFNREQIGGDRKPINLGVNLLRVCKQIRDEAMFELYSRNTFCMLPDMYADEDYYHREASDCCKFPREVKHGLSRLCYSRNRDSQIEAYQARLAGSTHSETNCSHIRNLEILLPSRHLTVTFIVYDPWTGVSVELDPAYPRDRPRHWEGDKTTTVEYFRYFASLMPKAPKTRFDCSLLTDDQPERTAKFIAYVQEGFGVGEAGLQRTETRLCTRTAEFMSVPWCECCTRGDYGPCSHDGGTADCHIEDESDDEDRFENRFIGVLEEEEDGVEEHWGETTQSNFGVADAVGAGQDFNEEDADAGGDGGNTE